MGTEYETTRVLSVCERSTSDGYLDGNRLLE
jgi:hypothetical protein